MNDGRGTDLVCIGRTSVDLYAEQDGARLEDVQSFRKYVGGSATNIAVGTARLGVRSAMLTRVGDEHMGRYVTKTLEENGVDVSQVRSDHEIHWDTKPKHHRRGQEPSPNPKKTT